MKSLLKNLYKLVHQSLRQIILAKLVNLHMGVLKLAEKWFGNDKKI